MKNLLFILAVLLVSAPMMAQQKGGGILPDTLRIENRGELSPARTIEGKWEGTMTACDNSPLQRNQRTDRMTLDIKQNGNKITGTMTFGSAKGTFEGLINGAYLDFTCQIGNGCIKVHGSFTSTNMKGMRGSNPPPYITCGDQLNNGRGSKGLEWQLTKK